MINRLIPITILLSLALAWPAAGEQIYVRNKAFKGAVTGSSGSFWVELKSFAEALGAKVVGDEQNGYSAAKAESTPPGLGKVMIEGSEIEFTTASDGSIMVPLDQAAKLLGARVVANKGMGTVDVSLVPTTKPVAGLFDGAPYTLIVFESPGQPISDYIQPAVAQAAEQFKNVQQVHCNVNSPGAQRAYFKYKTTGPGVYPEVTLVDIDGKVLISMKGNHVIAGGLIPEMRKKVKTDR